MTSNTIGANRWVGNVALAVLAASLLTCVNQEFSLFGDIEGELLGESILLGRFAWARAGHRDPSDR